MMDHKTWLWKRRSTGKTLTKSDKMGTSQGGNEEKKLLNDKAELERDLTFLNEKLSLAVMELKAKDDFSMQQVQMAHEAIAGWEIAEGEALSLKQELEKSIQQRVVDEEKLISLDAALKECMQQLSFVREEQEKRIHDVMLKTSKEYEKMINVLEERLAENSKRLSILGAQNNELHKALLAKEKVIEGFHEHKVRSEADIRTLTTRLESIEKQNASLKYEVRVVEKELEIRNEERDFNCQTAELAHKQHLENVKKIAKLELECQRLRLLVRKRLPGPAALAKMKIEVGILDRDPAEVRRRRLTSTGSTDFSVNAPGTKRINYLPDHLYPMEENRSLKESLVGTTNDLHPSRGISCSTTSRISEVKAQVDYYLKGQAAEGQGENLLTSREHPMASISDAGSDEKFSHAESWDSAFVSEYESLRNGKTETPSFRRVGASEINLMDDFVEMEKLAIISLDKAIESSSLASEGCKLIGCNLEAQTGGNMSEAIGGKIMTIPDCPRDLSVSNQGIQYENILIDNMPSWMDDIVKAVVEQAHVTQRDPCKMLDDIQVALTHLNTRNPKESVDPEASLSHAGVSNTSSLKPSDKSSIKDLADSLMVDETSLAEKSNRQLSSDLSKSVRKIIELVEGINLPSSYGKPEIFGGKTDYFPCKTPETPAGYMVRVFQWKISDLSVILQKVVQICNDVLNGKADFEIFTKELTHALDWIMNHCFSLQDVSSMRDTIKKQFDWDDSRSEGDVEGGVIDHFPGTDNLHAPIFSDWKCHNNLLQMEELGLNEREESLKSEAEFTNKHCEKEEMKTRLESKTSKDDPLMVHIQESERTIESLQVEVETLTQSKRTVKDQFEISKMMKEDHGAKLTTANYKTLSKSEDELENKNICDKNIQQQQESITAKQMQEYDIKEEKKQLQNDLEMTVVSQKLAECRETILHLGRQFQAIASPGDASVLDKVISTTTNASTMKTTEENKPRTSLLDKMLAEDNAKYGYPKSPKTKDILCTRDSPARLLNSSEIKHQDREVVIVSSAIVRRKKTGTCGSLRKLLWKEKKGNSKN